jgi:hypothetical protein
LTQYLDLFEQAKRRVDDPGIAAQLVTEVGKDRRGAMMRHDRSDRPFVGRRENGEDAEPATPNQLGLLRRLNAEIPPGLTQRQASGLIDDAKARTAAR